MTIGFGIVGCGMISNFHARAIADVRARNWSRASILELNPLKSSLRRTAAKRTPT